MKKLVYLLLFPLACITCKKTDAPKPEPLPQVQNNNLDSTGYLDIEISNMVENIPLTLNTATYTNANHDTFTVTTFKYYISNVVLSTPTGTIYIEPESYYLVDQSNSTSLHLRVKGVPFAHYNSINFLIGVDKLRNTSGAQTGVLDPINNMFWSWSSGYIMAKMEGTSPQSGNISKDIMFHMTGFQGANSVLKNVTIPFNTDAIVANNHSPVLKLSCNLAEWFKPPFLVDFSSTFNVVSTEPKAKSIADNYADMFTFVSITN